MGAICVNYFDKMRLVCVNRFLLYVGRKKTIKRLIGTQGFPVSKKSILFNLRNVNDLLRPHGTSAGLDLIEIQLSESVSFHEFKVRKLHEKNVNE